MISRLRIIAPLAMLGFSVVDAHAQTYDVPGGGEYALAHGQGFMTGTGVPIPAAMWIGVHSVAPITWTLTGDSWVGSLGEPVLAESTHLAGWPIWEYQSSPRSLVLGMRFSATPGDHNTEAGGYVSGVPGEYFNLGFGRAPSGAIGFINGVNESQTQPLCGDWFQFSGVAYRSPAANWASGASSFVRGSSSCGPGTSGQGYALPGGISTLHGRLWFSEARIYTYSNTESGLELGPGGCVARIELWLSTGWKFKGTPTNKWVWESCTGFPVYHSSAIDAIPGVMVAELRVYPGLPPVGAAAMLFEEEFPTEPETIPGISTDDWFTAELEREPDDFLKPWSSTGAENPLGDGPKGILPSWIPQGDAMPADWVITIPLSAISLGGNSPWTDMVVTIDFEIWNPVRLILRGVLIAFSYLWMIRSLWNELGGRSDPD